jgi:hypothetical protein
LHLNNSLFIVLQPVTKNRLHRQRQKKTSTDNKKFKHYNIILNFTFLWNKKEEKPVCFSCFPIDFKNLWYTIFRCDLQENKKNILRVHIQIKQYTNLVSRGISIHIGFII